jgi:HlyD family secretion protein
MFFTENKTILPPLNGEEFLPPVSRWTSIAGFFLLGNIGVAIALASSVKYNVTVKANAAVRPAGEVKVVQSVVEGTIKSIFVKENQFVKKGDAIARLDDLESRIKKSQLEGNIQETRLQLVQVESQIQSLDNQIEAERKVIERTIASAQADLTLNQRDFQDKQIKTHSESMAAQANLQKAKAGLQKVIADLEFAKTDRDRYKQLANMGAVGKREYELRLRTVEQAQLTVETEKKAIDIAKANLNTANTGLNPSNATVAIARERIAQESAKGESSIAILMRDRKALVQRQIEVRNQMMQAQKELMRNKLQIESSVIRASSDGLILKLNLRNPDQVVRSSEAIAEIIPQNTPLLLKAMIPASDIKKVAVGHKVQLRFDGCPYPDYGTLFGKVDAISGDAIAPQVNNTSGSVASAALPGTGYFEATIKPDKMSFGNSKAVCNIQAGMDAKADIISKEETPMQFILRRARLISDI